jgi:hypothetical protein
MSEIENLFDRISQNVDEGRIPESLDLLAEHFRTRKKFPELFETLKAAIRYRLGLPLFYRGEPDDLTTDQQDLLEDQLLDACREVGTALLKQGDIAQGWVYLQPLPDRDHVTKLVEQLDVTESNIDEIIEIALGQWAAPEFGYRLLLDQRGTCNAITFYDTQVFAQSDIVQRELAGILVDHVYRELCENVARCIQENEECRDLSQQSLEMLIADRDWLFANCGHHLDVTHLASVMRIARICDDPPTLKKALELADYGCQLDEQLDLVGDPPFEQNFADHKLFFQALIGIDVQKSIGHFASKAASVDIENAGLVVQQVVINLLHRTGNSEQAIQHAIQISNQLDPNELATLLIQIAGNRKDFETIMEYFHRKRDLLSYSLAAVKREESDRS